MPNQHMLVAKIVNNELVFTGETTIVDAPTFSDNPYVCSDCGMTVEEDELCPCLIASATTIAEILKGQ